MTTYRPVDECGNGNAARVNDAKFRKLTNGEDFVVVTDDAALLDWLPRQGLPAADWSMGMRVPDGSNVLLVMCHHRLDQNVRKQFARARVLLVPMFAFDNDPETVLYTLQQVLATDFSEGRQQNEDWVDLLRNKQDGTLHFTGPGTDLQCKIGDDIEVFTSVQLDIEDGQWVSVADYCEVQLTAPAVGDWLGSFLVEGVVEAAGVLAAEDARASEDGRERVRRARSLRRQLVADGPVRLEISESALRYATVAGRDVTDAISNVTNPDYGLHLTEVGLGSNPGVLSSVRWELNSQLNEGAGTFHLGFGEGITGAHMDFVVATCNVS